MSAKVSLNGILRVLRHRGYAIFTGANFASMSGEWIQRVGVGWLTWELTQSATWLGIIACADMLPAILISPIAGTYADRVNRLRFARWAAAAGTLQPLVLGLLYFTGLLDIWWLLGLALYNAVANSFKQSAWHSVIPSLVPRENIATAVVLGSMIYNLSRFIGPAVAGALIAFAGVGYTFVVNFAAAAGHLIALNYITLLREEAPRKRTGNIFRETMDGVRYTAAHPGIGPLMFLLLGSSLGQRPFIDLLPGFAADVFQRGPEALGWMVSMVGLGALAGALYLAIRPSMRGQSALAINGVLISALALLAFTVSTNFWLGMLCLLVAGSGLSLSGVGVMSLVQSAVDDGMRGRVLSLYGLIFRSGPALGALIMGYAAEYVGLGWPVAAGAALCLIFWAITIRRQPRIAAIIEQDNGIKPRAPQGAAPIRKAGE